MSTVYHVISLPIEAKTLDVRRLGRIWSDLSHLGLFGADFRRIWADFGLFWGYLAIWLPVGGRPYPPVIWYRLANDGGSFRGV